MRGLCSTVERSEREGLGGDLLGNPLASQQRSPSPGEPSLESEMAKAVQESRMLKAVVVPLEEVCKGGGIVFGVMWLGCMPLGDRQPEVTTGRSKRETAAY